MGGQLVDGDGVQELHWLPELTFYTVVNRAALVVRRFVPMSGWVVS